MIVLALVVFIVFEAQLLIVLDNLEKIKEFFRRMCEKYDREKQYNNRDSEKGGNNA